MGDRGERGNERMDQDLTQNPGNRSQSSGPETKKFQDDSAGSSELNCQQAESNRTGASKTLQKDGEEKEEADIWSTAEVAFFLSVYDELVTGRETGGGGEAALSTEEN